MKTMVPLGTMQKMFADFAADIQKGNPEYGDSLIAGFKIALEEWRQYYSRSS